MTRQARKVAALAAVTLIGGVLPTIGLTAASHAAAACEHEYNQSGLFGQYTCDDITQPDTSVSASPSVNDAGWVNENSVTLTFAAVAPGDPDRPSMTLRCKLTGPSQAFAEKDCTSPLTLTGLTDSADAYTFTVHAVDDGGPSNLNGDNETTNAPLDFVTPKEVVTKDYDESPATVSWRQDTTPPRGWVIGGPNDEITPEFPVLWATKTSYTIGSGEKPVSVHCTLNDASLPCLLGTNTLTKLFAGTKTFSVRVKDPAGNADTMLRTARFTVPYNDIGSAAQRLAWTRVTKVPGYFRGDYLQTSKKYAELTTGSSISFTELRIMVPKGPGLGRFRVKIGDYYFRIINESSTTEKHEVITLRGPKSAVMSGVLKFYTIDNLPVRFDGVMYR